MVNICIVNIDLPIKLVCVAKAAKVFSLLSSFLLIVVILNGQHNLSETGAEIALMCTWKNEIFLKY